MSATNYTLVIGDKNFSSWSLRPWLAMKQLGIAFAEQRVRLRQPDSKASILCHSPSGKVPALKCEHGVICESLAILEYLAERHPDSGIWPADAWARALARALAAEMHAGFPTLRSEMSMDLLARLPAPAQNEPLTTEITRMVTIWRETRARFGQSGPFLFGRFSAADAMFAPVATRFRTYGTELRAYGDDGTALVYAETILALPAMAEWMQGAEEEIRSRTSEIGNDTREQ